MWLTSHSRPPVLWPVTWASTIIPSFRSLQSPMSAAASGSRKSYRPSSALSRCTTTSTASPALGGGAKLVQGHAALLAAAQLDEDLVAPHGDDAPGVSRLRLEDFLRAEHAAAPHQGVEGRVAQRHVEFGVHVQRIGRRFARLGRRRFPNDGRRRRGRRRGPVAPVAGGAGSAALGGGAAAAADSSLLACGSSTGAQSRRLRRR